MSQTHTHEILVENTQASGAQYCHCSTRNPKHPLSQLRAMLVHTSQEETAASKWFSVPLLISRQTLFKGIERDMSCRTTWIKEKTNQRTYQTLLPQIT